MVDFLSINAYILLICVLSCVAYCFYEAVRAFVKKVDGWKNTCMKYGSILIAFFLTAIPSIVLIFSLYQIEAPGKWFALNIFYLAAIGTLGGYVIYLANTKLRITRIFANPGVFSVKMILGYFANVIVLFVLTCVIGTYYATSGIPNPNSDIYSEAPAAEDNEFVEEESDEIVDEPEVTIKEEETPETKTPAKQESRKESYSEPSPAPATQTDSAKPEATVRESSLTKQSGVNYYNGRKETYYSSRVLHHYRTSEWTPDDRGVYRDADGYVVVAAEDVPEGGYVDTSFGMGKVYDCGCPYGTTDIYVNW